MEEAPEEQGKSERGGMLSCHQIHYLCCSSWNWVGRLQAAIRECPPKEGGDSVFSPGLFSRGEIDVRLRGTGNREGHLHSDPSPAPAGPSQSAALHRFRACTLHVHAASRACSAEAFQRGRGSRPGTPQPRPLPSHLRFPPLPATSVSVLFPVLRELGR